MVPHGSHHCVKCPTCPSEVCRRDNERGGWVCLGKCRQFHADALPQLWPVAVFLVGIGVAVFAKLVFGG